MKLNIGVIIGGPSPEHDISVLTGLQVARILKDKYEISVIYWSKDNQWYLNSPELEGEDFLDQKKVTKSTVQIQLNDNPGFYIKKKKLIFDVLLNACHGGPGEDGTLQSVLDLIGTPYTGPDTALAQICIDKYLFSLLMKENNLPVLDRTLVKESEESLNFGSPYIIKPRFGGSSIGVEVVKDLNTAKSLIKGSELYNRGAVIEKYIEGSEDLLIAAFGYPEINLSEIEKPLRNYHSSPIFDYKDKYLRNGGLEGSSRELPAELSEKDEKEIISLALKLIDVIGVRGIYRIDFLKKEDEIFINEVNSIPGSLSTYLWKNTDISKFELIENIINEALSSEIKKLVLDGADGEALANAKDIESKLG